MATLLQVDSSPRGVYPEGGTASHRSISRTLTKQLIQMWQHTDPNSQVTYRDVGRYPVPPIDEAWIAAAFTPPDQLNPNLETALKISDELIDELFAADFLVFGIPMYNYSVPANFKAYIDQIVRVRRTFAIDSDGYQGLVSDKRAVVITTRGGSYANSPLDFQEPYLRAVFEFIGITDIAFIHAENLAMGTEARQRAIASAQASIHQIIANWQQ
ncbi:NAD(P)H-dependent oxidoreductase [Oscillatoria sp. FACHB-1407]|uniref:FMN-dependent NADH-azoreductase n=1 Tax=Oscillatoria sp. FACHB-1407 TaxID=2692847 RepID=UPI0016829A2F|nr:NAD(P)H-dependent oxidoreductase [Oscillatoria sp. FACHB-1407]MBD2465932.1 NAD(P)H-dependent oxidoreductase [Oscillatoria sp. FACHB-1407]